MRSELRDAAFADGYTSYGVRIRNGRFQVILRDGAERRMTGYGASEAEAFEDAKRKLGGSPGEPVPEVPQREKTGSIAGTPEVPAAEV